MPAKAKKSKKNVPPPPPPEILYLTGEEDFNSMVLQHQGFCLVAVVAQYCNICVRTVIPYLEKLNLERPPALTALRIVVIFAGENSLELCRSLDIITVPTFFSYSYGKVVHEFCGDNVERALLISRIAAQKAEDDKRDLELAEAAAAAAAAAATAAATAVAAEAAAGEDLQGGVSASMIPAENQSPAAP